MNRILIILSLLILGACANSDRSEIPEDIKLYANQLMYFYEDPTVERFALTIEYRTPALKRMFRECNASAYKHALTADSVFFGLTKEKYGFELPSNEPLDGIQWTAEKLNQHEVKYGGDLDYLWAAFFATGDLKWIDLLVNYISSTDPGISGTAKWSCNANYRQHRKIKEYIDSKPQLKEVIFAVKKPD